MSVITTPETQAHLAGGAADLVEHGAGDGAGGDGPGRRPARGIRRIRPVRHPKGIDPTRRQQAVSAGIFLFVPVALFAVFGMLPIVIAAVISFTDYAIIGDAAFVGGDNFARILDDPFFWISLRNTAWYTLLYVPLGLVVALATALLLNRKARAVRLFRTLFYIPVVSSTVATASIWFWLLNPQYGLLNTALGWVGIDGPAWLYSSQWAMPAIVLMSVWAGFGGNMIIFLGGLQSVPEELKEAARLDGANAWQVFRHVTVPALSRTTFLVSTLLIIGAFQVFDQAYVLTKGGPATRRSRSSTTSTTRDSGRSRWATPRPCRSCCSRSSSSSRSSTPA